MNYMVLNGLNENGYHDLAYKIADKYLSNVVKNYNHDKTLWENYSPEGPLKGNPAKPNFVGWTGLAPISIFFEYVLGIKSDVVNNCIHWHVNKIEKHGILQYPFGIDGEIDLICEKRESLSDEPNISIKSNIPVKVIVYYDGKEKEIKVNM